MSADARLLGFKEFVNILTPEIRRLNGSRPHRLATRSDIDHELAVYALAIYRHKIGRKRMLAEGRITEL